VRARCPSRNRRSPPTHSDHGDHLYAHGVEAHKNSFFEESWRVPLAVRLPPLLRVGGSSADYRDPVSLVDLLPTVIGLVLGGERNPKLGISSAASHLLAAQASGRDLSGSLLRLLDNGGGGDRFVSEQSAVVGQGAMLSLGAPAPDELWRRCSWLAKANFSVAECGEWRAAVSRTHKLVVLRAWSHGGACATAAERRSNAHSPPPFFPPTPQTAWSSPAPPSPSPRPCPCSSSTSSTTLWK
jgi:hypothetical protein